MCVHLMWGIGVIKTYMVNPHLNTTRNPAINSSVITSSDSVTLVAPSPTPHMPHNMW